MKDFSKLEKKTKIKFADKNLLKQAFVHKSYLNENPSFNLEDNERLEFLGDAVLELVVTEYLFKNYKNPEGELTNWRSALVKGYTISAIAKKLGFNDFLYLSRGESKSSGRSRNLILANTFEAFVGALYLDKGLRVVEEFLNQYLIVKLPDILKKELYRDPKSKLQEFTQEKLGITPHYQVLEESGPDHAKKFKVGVFLDKKLIGKGMGYSKQIAEQSAANNALRKLNSNT